MDEYSKARGLRSYTSLRADEQLGDAVAAYVRDMIMSGEFVAGLYIRLDRVAEDLGISVTPVRDGMQRLAARGMVNLAPRRGFVVVPIEPQDIRDLFTAQALLAGELAERAARQITPDEISELMKRHREFEEAAARRNIDEIEAGNHRFHRQVNQAASAPKIALQLRTCTEYVPSHFFSSQPSWVEESLGHHQAIIQGLEDGDPKLVGLAMQQHMLRAGILLANHLAERQQEAKSSEVVIHNI
jgi:DNA-binding GntR family transcriptional regulator